MDIAFQLDEVTVDFAATRALNGVSLTISQGERVALVGPSGSGKTTLLRLLSGMVRPSSGVARAFGRSLGELSTAELRNIRRRLGFVHQGLSLAPNLRVLQNVLAGRMGGHSFISSLRSMLLPSSRQTQDVHDLLDRVGIEEKLYERTDRLSGGQQQRVAIARALYQRPDAILADEPVASVDPARARDTIGLLTEVAADGGLTLCTSLHDLRLAREFFPRLIGLRGGEIVFDRATAELSEDEFDILYKLSEEELLADLVES